MSHVIAKVAVLVAMVGCAQQPLYQVGRDSGKQTREEAERAYATTAPVSMSAAVDAPPKILSSRFPEYPSNLRSRDIAGSVVVVFTIDENGLVSDPMVVGRPPAEFAALVLDAIQQWKFRPATENGVPVKVRAQQAFSFKVE